MNLHVLDETLRRLGIPTTLVSLGSGVDSAWCVVPADSGSWEVYWLSQGTTYSHVVLDDEPTACYCLLGKLVYDQVLAGEFELPG
ncbi:MAG: hypothetical protein GEV09_03745 [Pseudonocardiaceae bacterium]|nr:hypothetical protein [Pseudonocardiaceae bacterium]